jgi:hypothetical protein
MKNGIVAAALCLACALAPIASRADQPTATLNAFTAEQAIDCLTTMAVLHAGGSERDPVAVPFTRSALTEFGAAAVLNLAARHVPLRILRTVVNVYPVILLGNIRALGESAGSAGFVPAGAVQATGPGRVFRSHPRG